MHPSAAQACHKAGVFITYLRMQVTCQPGHVPETMINGNL